MGLRFRKSIHLGGGFRINLSKSGIGYSFGVKGFRVTRTAKGRIRKTASIPGTGIAYTTEKGIAKKSQYDNNHSSSVTTQELIADNELEIVNTISADMQSEGLETLVSSVKTSVILDKLANYGFLISAILFLFVGFTELSSFPLSISFLAVVLIALILKIIARTKGRISLDYNIAEDINSNVYARIEAMKHIAECKKVWKLTAANYHGNGKQHGGAEMSIKRTKCRTNTKRIFPFTSNYPIVSFKTKKETLIFLPDKLFVLQGFKVGALNYSNIVVNVTDSRFVERDTVPKDTTILKYTWEKVNKSGTRDKRYQDNKQLPVCQYGCIGFESKNGLNTILMFSNSDAKPSPDIFNADFPCNE